MKRCLVILTLCVMASQNFAQTKPDSIRTLPVKHSFFGNIYTGFYYSPSDHAIPQTGFDFTTGLLGFRGDWGDKASVTLIYDVSKTTNDIIVTDTAGILLPVTYTKGSDYTAFLKMAQIDFKPYPWLELNAGQMLNQQYLTFQDKFWGFRYISTTFQELYRFGSPADFGFRATVKYKDKMNVSAGVVNGDGPFRKQDTQGALQYFGNIEIFPVKGFSIKAFADMMPVEGKNSRSALSFFMGYKCDQWRLGGEFNKVFYYILNSNTTFEGVSVYGAYRIAERWQVLLRCDYLTQTLMYENDAYLMAGGEFEPYKGLYISLNGRYLSEGEIPWIFMNFGAKF